MARAMHALFIVTCFILVTSAQYVIFQVPNGQAIALANPITPAYVALKTYNVFDLSQHWLFVNATTLGLGSGYFVAARQNSTLVFDVSGGVVQAGSRIDAYPQKTTTSSTFNQRWNWNPNQGFLTAVQTPSVYVASVNGNIQLATLTQSNVGFTSSAAPALYTIIVIGNTDIINITFVNVPYPKWIVPANSSSQMSLLAGVKFIARNSIGYVLAPDPYTVSNNATLSFTDIDECASGIAMCPNTSTCVNTVDSYNCTCLPGYNGSQCLDINECTMSPYPCDMNANCTNTIGSFTCSCNAGYSGNGFTCTDVNECALGTDNCTTNAVCTNTVGSFTCSCQSGYTGDGYFNCTDINECVGTNNCSIYATCENTPGSYQCTCHPGFTGNGITCDDINECAVFGLPRCSGNSICTNTIGSYECSCMPGYRCYCADIDECAEMTDLCDTNAECTNTNGGYTCACDPGFTGDGYTCTDIDECELSPPPCQGSNIICENLPGSYECSCLPGYQLMNNTCVDINECLGTPSPCDSNATCTNTPGSFSCQCNPGFSGNGSYCLATTCANLSNPIDGKVWQLAAIPMFSVMRSVYYSVVNFCGVASSSCNNFGATSIACENNIYSLGRSDAVAITFPSAGKITIHAGGGSSGCECPTAKSSHFNLACNDTSSSTFTLFGCTTIYNINIPTRYCS